MQITIGQSEEGRAVAEVLTAVVIHAKACRNSSFYHAFINNLNEEICGQGAFLNLGNLKELLSRCSSNKSLGLGHPAPLPHSDCNAEPVEDIERGEFKQK